MTHIPHSVAWYPSVFFGGGGGAGAVNKSLISLGIML